MFDRKDTAAADFFFSVRGDGASCQVQPGAVAKETSTADMICAQEGLLWAGGQVFAATEDSWRE